MYCCYPYEYRKLSSRIHDGRKNIVYCTKTISTSGNFPVEFVPENVLNGFDKKLRAYHDGCRLQRSTFFTRTNSKSTAARSFRNRPLIYTVRYHRAIQMVSIRYIHIFSPFSRHNIVSRRPAGRERIVFLAFPTLTNTTLTNVLGDGGK